MVPFELGILKQQHIDTAPEPRSSAGHELETGTTVVLDVDRALGAWIPWKAQICRHKKSSQKDRSTTIGHGHW